VRGATLVSARPGALVSRIRTLPANSDPRDGLDAARRARTSYRPGWSALDAAREIAPAVFALGYEAGDQWTAYAYVQLVEVGGERGWRAVTADEPRQLIGYWTRLRIACDNAHRAWLRTRSVPGEPRATWAGRTAAEVDAGR